MSHNANKSLLIVDDRHRDEVIAGQFLSHIFAIFIHPHPNHVALHNVRQTRLRFRQNQLSQRNQTFQPPVAVQDVDIVDRFAVRSLLAQALQCFFRSNVGRQRSILSRHDRTSAMLVVRQQSSNIIALSLSDQWQQVFDTILRHPRQQVDAVVRRHFFE